MVERLLTAVDRLLYELILLIVLIPRLWSGWSCLPARSFRTLAIKLIPQRNSFSRTPQGFSLSFSTRSTLATVSPLWPGASRTPFSGAPGVAGASEGLAFRAVSGGFQTWFRSVTRTPSGTTTPLGRAPFLLRTGHQC